MATLRIHQGHQRTEIVFHPPAALSELLSQAGFVHSHPCGGRGTCGKCAVMLSGAVSAPTPAELRCGVRLACQVTVCGDASVTLPAEMAFTQIAGGSAATLTPIAPASGYYGAAIDIGTTTLALLLYDLHSGQCIGASSMLNPQTAVAADVIGRIDSSLRGQAEMLRLQVEKAIQTLLASACSNVPISAQEVQSLVITGNTTMLYLLTGQDPTSLSKAPFAADCLFGMEAAILGTDAFLPHCLHAFVGADTTCALLAAGMLESNATALLCDVGTNGELALWHKGRLYIASTAAGPAFEGAGISCGCGSIPGAIDRVTWADDRLVCHTICDQKPVGLCGSGLVDAVAALLDADILDETGYLEDEQIRLQDDVRLTQADIRAVQLAKAATHAGIMSLLAAAKCSPAEIEKVFLAGGFGSHLNLRSAARIGLIPAELADKVQVIGNAALDGAAMLMLNTRLRSRTAAIRQVTEHVRLDGNPDFVQRYVDAMMFEE